MSMSNTLGKLIAEVRAEKGLDMKIFRRKGISPQYNEVYTFVKGGSYLIEANIRGVSKAQAKQIEDWATSRGFSIKVIGTDAGFQCLNPVAGAVKALEGEKK